MYENSETDKNFFKPLVLNFSLEKRTKFTDDLFLALPEKLIFIGIDIIRSLNKLVYKYKYIRFQWEISHN